MKNFVALTLVLTAFLFLACEKDSALTDTDLSTNTAAVMALTTSTVSEGKSLRDAAELYAGLDSCFTLVFPVSIVYPDSTQVTYDDIETLTADVAAWVAANEGTTGHPHIVLPVDILIAGDTTATTIEQFSQIHDIVHNCLGVVGGGHHGGGHGGGHQGGVSGSCGDIFPTVDSCFTVVFPISITYPDSTVVSYADAATLTAALQAWATANTGTTGRPEVVFPIEILVAGDTTNTIINSRDELRAAASACIGDGHGHGDGDDDHGQHGGGGNGGGHGGNGGGHGGRGGRGGN